MKILSIETSCDDTGIAILNAKNSGNFEVLANIISSQIEVHKKYGGVFPAMAKREHQKNILPTLTKALEKAELLKPTETSQIENSKLKILNSILEREPDLQKKLILFLKKYKKPNIDLISVTNGPGLEPCLWVGVNLAKALSFYWNIPIIPVNHIESHILINFLKYKEAEIKKIFPAIALVVSGGHTQIILVNNIGKYKILGETRDDAAGECFDKCAKILGLSYPGGPEIAAEAAKFKISNLKFQIKLPRPMISTKDYDFSFSGLKTAVLYAVKKDCGEAPLRQGFAGRQYIEQMCVEVQQAIIDVLLKKTIKAAKDFNVKTIILGGGVTANKELKKQLGEKIEKELPGKKYLAPDVSLSTDNGLMIALTAYFKIKKHKPIKWQNIKADSNLRI